MDDATAQTPLHAPRSVHVRPYQPDDAAFVRGLAPRLTIGMPAYRDPQRCLAAVEGWIAGSIDQHGQAAAVFVAEDNHGERLGFASVSAEPHFPGERQASIGELATSAAAEGQGVGRALLRACEDWARAQGFRIIALSTGAANTRALGFYHQHGYRDEDIRLIRLLDARDGDAEER
ncbi:GNAT family N-acetyltransferase [Oscillochloris sp. ZM17-4]|uniref:GNAT family N-acetyltransferase n=1 Tax=Oscillochloris sp. ZM17-4 TaxID=2866714 RepID=UPI001C73D8FB|nr:GNAT family N-acetyltransferase [Oscillochloris sp. ZM17-4]MBX0329661.1 GNAT family N-acetyltransferase [Oscillochloris sp. ZM17-4]